MAAWPANVSFAQLLAEYAPARPHRRWAINIGARDGVNDPIYPLLQARGHAAVLIEGDRRQFRVLHQTARAVNASGNVHIMWGYVTPSTLVRRLELEYGMPRQLSALKCDVDSVDRDLLEALFAAGYEADVSAGLIMHVL